MTNRILISFIFLMFFSTYQIKAQFHIGAKAGANLTKVDGSSFENEFELGYQVGGFIYYNFSDFVGLQSEVLFNQTNTKLTQEFSDVIENAFDRDKTLNYISVPVLLRLNTSGIISLSAGPQFSFLANPDKNVFGNGETLFKDTDFSAIAGVDLNLTPLTIYARYVWGFTDISEITEKANSQQIQFGLALRLF